MLEGNRDVIVCAQKKDADAATKLQIGEVIFQLFLYLSSKLENIIFSRTMKNSSYNKSASLEARTKGRKIIRNIGSSSDKQITK